MATLPGKVSEIERQNPDQDHFYIVYQLFVFQDVPTEAIPAISSPVALIRVPESLPDIALPNVDRSRAVIKNIDALPAFTASRNGLDVLRISRPHLAELPE
jgi:hypothetical protein